MFFAFAAFAQIALRVNGAWLHEFYKALHEYPYPDMDQETVNECMDACPYLCGETCHSYFLRERGAISTYLGCKESCTHFCQRRCRENPVSVCERKCPEHCYHQCAVDTSFTGGNFGPQDCRIECEEQCPSDCNKGSLLVVCKRNCNSGCKVKCYQEFGFTVKARGFVLEDLGTLYTCFETCPRPCESECDEIYS